MLSESVKLHRSSEARVKTKQNLTLFKPPTTFMPPEFNWIMFDMRLCGAIKFCWVKLVADAELAPIKFNWGWPAKLRWENWAGVMLWDCWDTTDAASAKLFKLALPFDCCCCWDKFGESRFLLLLWAGWVRPDVCCCDNGLEIGTTPLVTIEEDVIEGWFPDMFWLFNTSRPDCWFWLLFSTWIIGAPVLGTMAEDRAIFAWLLILEELVESIEEIELALVGFPFFTWFGFDVITLVCDGPEFDEEDFLLPVLELLEVELFELAGTIGACTGWSVACDSAILRSHVLRRSWIICSSTPSSKKNSRILLITSSTTPL